MRQQPHPNHTPAARQRVAALAADCAAWAPAAVADHIEALAARNRAIHERDCLNLNPATNSPNPRAEALLASGVGNRPSLGHPGEKYEMGLEAIEAIEVACAELACQLFDCHHAEIRVGSGALCNLYAFMACARPGDTLIAPPAAISGHVTHHAAGAAGLYGLRVVEAPVDAAGHTVEVEALRQQARALRPAMISIGGSLNYHPHPLGALREIADEVGATLLYDAAHLSGLIAGRAWQQPLAEGAHLVSMSTYKSLGGPAGGLLLSDDAALIARLDRVAFPGLTANFDAARAAALAVTLADWLDAGADYAAAMVATARALGDACAAEGLPVHGWQRPSCSHQFALQAAPFGGGQTAARRLRDAGLLSCGIGLPIAPVAGDLNGLRLGSPELPRWGIGPAQMPQVARWLAEALHERRPAAVIAAEVADWRRGFDRLHYVCGGPRLAR